MRRRILGTLAYLLFLLCFVEVALQAFYYFTAGDFLFVRVGVPVFAPNEWSGFGNRPQLAYEHRTNEIRASYFTNGQGFRVPEGRGDYSRTPPPGTTRIMLLGPSFAYGWGVDYEDTFANRLERQLRDMGWSEGTAEIINAGVPSLGISPQLEWFRHEGRLFHPKLVIQFVYGGMAVTDVAKPDQQVEDGYLVNRDPPFTARLRARAKKFATVFYGWILYTRIGDAWLGEQKPHGVAGAGRELQLQRDFDLADPAVRESLGLYRRLRREVEAAGAKLVLVFFPLSYAVHPEDMGRWRHLGVMDVPAARAFDAAFCDHLTRVEAIPCLDITDDLRETAAASGERLYYWLDVHWTALGNEAAAMAVAKRLPSL